MSNTKKIVFILIILIIMISVFVLRTRSVPYSYQSLAVNHTATTTSFSSTVSTSTIPYFMIGTTTVNVEIADTVAEQEKGLSNRTSLAHNAGMLFIFPRSDVWAFWMKDTLIPLDMIWLDGDYSIVGIKENALPGSYPETFKPQAPALYVIEVNAGFVEQHHMKLGSKIMLELGNYK